MNYGRTWAQIDLSAICHNVGCVRKKIPQDVKLLVVIKADAYGHGAVEVAKALQNLCDFFGVASVAEGVELCKAGIRTPILVLGYTDKFDFPHAVEYGIRPTIFTMEQAEMLSREAFRQGKTALFHFAVDTGMSRIGFQVSDESAETVRRITRLPSICAEGIFSHYYASDDPDSPSVPAQQEKFDAFMHMLEMRNVHIPIRHMSNSAGILNLDRSYNMVRSGIITYGVLPSPGMAQTLDLHPALQWKSQVFHVKTLEAGRHVGYGGTYVTEKPTVVATIPVGYADGYPWCLSNRGRVILHGQYAPIIGRVCMDLLMVGVTEIPNVAEGDIVTLIGRDGDAELSVDAVAEASGTISYELLCSFTRRVPRVYIRDDREVTVVDYLE